MANPEDWINLTTKEQYEFLGFFHDTSKLLFIEDQTLLPSCPIKPGADYIYQDINLSKGSALDKFQDIHIWYPNQWNESGGFMQTNPMYGCQGTYE